MCQSSSQNDAQGKRPQQCHEVPPANNTDSHDMHLRTWRHADKCHAGIQNIYASSRPGCQYCVGTISNTVAKQEAYIPTPTVTTGVCILLSVVVCMCTSFSVTEARRTAMVSGFATRAWHCHEPDQCEQEGRQIARHCDGYRFAFVLSQGCAVAVWRVRSVESRRC